MQTGLVDYRKVEHLQEMVECVVTSMNVRKTMEDAQLNLW